MDIHNIILARKYAQAFLNLFENSIAMATYQSMLTLKKYLKIHKRALYFLSLHHIPVATKVGFTNQIAEQFQLPDPFKKLFETLVAHNRSQMIREVIKQICITYRARKNILLFEIQSSHELDIKARDIIKDFLIRKTNSSIIVHTNVNKDLIAGIRLQSYTLLWEYSIKKQLKELMQPTCQ